MRIGIEAQRLFRPHKYGMDIAALELIKTLQEYDNENQYFIFVKPDKDNNLLTVRPNFKLVEIPDSPYPWWEQVSFPRIIKKYNLDLLLLILNPFMHSVSYVGHLSNDGSLILVIAFTGKQQLTFALKGGPGLMFYKNYLTCIPL